MEDPLTMFDNDFHLSDSEMPYFSYPGVCADYQVTDFSNLSCLWDPQMSCQAEPNVHLDNIITSVSEGDVRSISSNESPELYEDLSNFFSEDLLSSPASDQPFATLNAQTSQSGYSTMPSDNHLASTAPNSSASLQATTPSTPLAICTSGFEPANHHMVMNNGQITPANSPHGIQYQLGESRKTAPASRRQSRKGEEVAAIIATNTHAPAAASAESEKNLKPLKGGKAKVKKPTKSQRPSKKTTIEKDVAKREAFLKRNKEAAYRCRMKVKAQKVEDAEKMMALKVDQASKALEIEKLRSEVYGLKRLLLSQFKETGDVRLLEYWDGFGGVGGVGCVGAGEGVGAGCHGDGIVVASVEGSFEDGGLNIDGEQG